MDRKRGSLTGPFSAALLLAEPTFSFLSFVVVNAGSNLYREKETVW